MNRRTVLLGLGGGLSYASVLGGIYQAAGQTSSRKELPNVSFDLYKPIPTLGEYRRQIHTKGDKDPYPKEIEQGNLLLKDIPLGSGVTPYQVAYRFHQWRKRQIGTTDKEKNEYSYYAREWPVRGNPIIMQFFDATGFRNPEGDTTYWCSAFVSWCISRTHKDGIATEPKIWPYKNGAASAAYRSWGEKVVDPRQGDLAVFKKRSDEGAGHIGFVDRVSSETIWVLGGNQGAQDEYNGGEVNIAPFARNGGKSLILHSFRRHPSLTKA